MCIRDRYDDVPIEDAPYFSALYGPARHAIVVRDLNTVREQLAKDVYKRQVKALPNI